VLFGKRKAKDKEKEENKGKVVGNVALCDFIPKMVFIDNRLFMKDK
jgi:hypothetical protein